MKQSVEMASDDVIHIQGIQKLFGCWRLHIQTHTTSHIVWGVLLWVHKFIVSALVGA
jgi:hypothetical protein